MNDIYVWFWTAMIYASIAWYAFLLFIVGGKGGFEILRMIKALSKQQNEQ